jgi:hypothetical protein
MEKLLKYGQWCLSMADAATDPHISQVYREAQARSVSCCLLLLQGKQVSSQWCQWVDNVLNSEPKDYKI